MFINKYLELFEKLKGVFREIGFCGFLELSIINFPYKLPLSYIWDILFPNGTFFWGGGEKTALQFGKQGVLLYIQNRHSAFLYLLKYPCHFVGFFLATRQK